MYRYVALVWDVEDAHAARTAELLSTRLATGRQKWTCGFDRPGVRIHHVCANPSSSTLHVLPTDRGAIVGRLFRTAGGAVQSLTGPEGRLIVDTDGRALVERYWGRYVAFVVADDGCVRVCRDPSAAMSCYMYRCDGVSILFSYLEDLVSAGIGAFTVNWRHVAAYLMFEFLRVPTTGLSEVTEVLGGECLTIGRDSMQRTFYWSPGTFAKGELLEDPDQAAETVRETAMQCTAEWASGYRTIIHDLSGGLDSSIVLACLARVRPQPRGVCLHFASERAESDELRFAQLAAERAGWPLIKRPIRSTSIRVHELFDPPRTPGPSIYVVGRLGSDDAHICVAREYAAEAFFSGQGGDQLFHQNASPFAAADLLRAHGVGSRFATIVRDTARLTRQSVWSVLRSAFVHGALARRVDPLASLNWDSSLVNRDVSGTLQAEDLLHPWLCEPGDLPAGKLMHIGSIISFQNHYLPFGRVEHADVVYPLFSQPIIELCLRTPTYVLTTGGRDRALERKAFAQDVPPQILARHGKADLTNYYSRMVSRDIAAVRELLLDGQLAAHGLIDRQRLERQLTPEGLVRGDQIADVIACLGAEAWAMNWASSRRKAAA